MYVIFILILSIVGLILLLKMGALFLIEESLSPRRIREESSPYECGFEQSRDSRLPFSIRYFLLTLIFLIFDLELVFLLFLPLRAFTADFSLRVVLGVVFLLVLFMGLLYE